MPGGRLTGTSDACSPIDGRDAATPALPGPIMRTPARRARVTSPSMSMSEPSMLVMTTAPRTRDSMQSSITSTRCAAGTPMTASDTSAGTSRTLGHERRPPTESWAGFTGNTAPVADAVTLCQRA